MAIKNIDYSIQQKDGRRIIKVYLEDTSKFQDRFFYTSVPDAQTCIDNLGCTQKDVLARVMDLLNKDKYNWYLVIHNSYECIRGYDKSNNDKIIYFTHKLYEAFHQKKVPSDMEIGVRNKVGYDVTDINLNIMSKSETNLAIFNRGYILEVGGFTPCKKIDGFNTRGNKCYTETDACIIQYSHERKLVESTFYNGYVYNILDDFSGNEDILNNIREGIITEEQGKEMLLDVKREDNLSIKENAWYVYRYNLFDFFTDRRITIPKFKLDDYGNMIHPVTGNRLCPFK